MRPALLLEADLESVDYLFIGHASRDLTADGPRLGGTVTFGAWMAYALGMRVGIVTSAPNDMLDLLSPLMERATVVCIPSANATTFTNTYTSAGRTQILSSQAGPLTFENIPDEWRGAPIVHLGPIAAEVDPALAEHFTESLVGVTPQGWMRQWDEAGKVSYAPWVSASQILSVADAVVLSIEDVQYDESVIQNLGAQAQVLIATRGSAGSTLYVGGTPQTIPSLPQPEVDPTGAGDVFATSFFFRYQSTGDPVQAAHFATILARDSVRRAGLMGIPSPDIIKQALKKA